METRSIGRVKWWRADGTGYVEAGGVSFYFDRTSLRDKAQPDAGAAVYFHPQLILNRWCALAVTTEGLSQPAQK